MWDLASLLWWLQRLSGSAGTVRRLIWFATPVEGASVWLAPLVGVASVLSLALLAGVAVGALTTFLVLLVAFSYLLTEVFGISIEWNPPARFERAF